MHPVDRFSETLCSVRSCCQLSSNHQHPEGARLGCPVSSAVCVKDIAWKPRVARQPVQGQIGSVQLDLQDNTFTEGRCQRYRECPGKLQQAVAALAAQQPRLTCLLTLGDIINGRHDTQDKDILDLSRVLHLLRPLVSPSSHQMK